MFLQFLVNLIEVRRVFPYDILKCGSDQWQTVHVPYGKTSCLVLLEEKKKKEEVLFYPFLIKVAAGYVTLENWKKHFQLGLMQWPHAFFFSRITFSKVLLMETDTCCQKTVKDIKFSSKSVKQWNVDKCWKTLINESFWH